MARDPVIVAGFFAVFESLRLKDSKIQDPSPINHVHSLLDSSSLDLCTYYVLLVIQPMIRIRISLPKIISITGLRLTLPYIPCSLDLNSFGRTGIKANIDSPSAKFSVPSSSTARPILRLSLRIVQRLYFLDGFLKCTLVSHIFFSLRFDLATRQHHAHPLLHGRTSPSL